MAFWTTRGVFTECKVGCTIACHIMAKANCSYQHDEVKHSTNIHYNETYKSVINADEKFVYKDCQLSRRRLQFTNKQTIQIHEINTPTYRFYNKAQEIKVLETALQLWDTFMIYKQNAIGLARYQRTKATNKLQSMFENHS